MGFPHSHLAVANVAVDDRFLNSVNAKVGAYTLDENTAATEGAHHVTVTWTAGDTADTEGTVDIVGTDLSGNVITETITPVTGTTVAGTKWFASVTSATGVGWVIDAVEVTNDTIEIGYGIETILVEGTGTLHSVVVNTTAAGTITIADATGTIAILASSIAVGSYVYEAMFYGYLQVTLGAASDVTILRDDNLAHPYALS
jgi:hypothetical protein